MADTGSEESFDSHDADAVSIIQGPSSSTEYFSDDEGNTGVSATDTGPTVQQTPNPLAIQSDAAPSIGETETCMSRLNINCEVKENCGTKIQQVRSTQSHGRKTKKKTMQKRETTGYKQPLTKQMKSDTGSIKQHKLEWKTSQKLVQNFCTEIFKWIQREENLYNTENINTVYNLVLKDIISKLHEKHQTKHFATQLSYISKDTCEFIANCVTGALNEFSTTLNARVIENQICSTITLSNILEQEEQKVITTWVGPLIIRIWSIYALQELKNGTQSLSVTMLVK